MNKKSLLDVAAGRQKAELVIKDAKYLNVFTGEILRGDIAIDGGFIAGIGDYEGEKTYYTDGLVVPGFIDGHVHIESSMSLPREFSAAAFKHGTTTVVCDPHEIANVAGEYGIKFLMDDSLGQDVDFKFTLPSCVPATCMDENYKPLKSGDLAKLFKDGRVVGLAEVMDFCAVVDGDTDMLKKIEYAKRYELAVDGHAPLLSGKQLNAYVSAGISSDHECTSIDEATAKLRFGQYIMIRQGTAAHNLKELFPLIDKYSDRCMLVTDDLHPELLAEVGHIDHVIREAVRLGASLNNAVRCATLTPATYFGLNDRGAIAPGRRADLVVLDENLFVIDAFSGGKKSRKAKKEWQFDSFNALPISLEQLDCGKRELIKLVPGEIITVDAGYASGVDGQNDTVKLFCKERHNGTEHFSCCYLSGYGIKRGAVATSIAHDSHNIIAAGYDEHIVTAVNELIRIGGGIVVTDGVTVKSLPLEIGGIMSAKPIAELAKMLEDVKQFAFGLGVSKDVDPFMTLSFLSLPVIPSIRLLPTGVVKV